MCGDGEKNGQVFVNQKRKMKVVARSITNIETLCPCTLM